MEEIIVLRTEQQEDEFSVTEVSENLKRLMRVPLEVTVELGKTEETIKEVMDFGVGKIITLDSNVGEPVNLLVNGQYFAEGEVVAVNKETYGVVIQSIISEQKRLDKLSESLK